jgi:replication factor A1
MSQLSTNAVRSLFNGTTGLTPTLQVIGVKQIPNNGTGATRYRLIISDGVNYQQAMLATQLNNLIDNQTLSVNCIVQIKEYICNQVQGRKIVIVLQLDVMQPATDKIGNPSNVETAAAQPVPTSAAPQYQQQQQAPAQNYQAPQANNTYQQNNNPYNKPSAPVVKNEGNVNVQPIASLNPYQNRWTIKARITNKGDMRTWQNARGEGKLFSVDLLDEHGDEIRGTFFKETADKFFNVLQEQSVYYFSGGRLKVANKKFSSLNNNYEITFDNHSDIRPAPDSGNIKKIQYAFKTIAELETTPPDTNVDIIGIVKDVGQCTQFTSKAGKDLIKRELTLVDNTGVEIGLTLWGERASEDESRWQGFPVVTAKGAKLGDYNGKSLSAFGSVQMETNPDIQEAHTLRQWYDTGGAQQQAKTLTQSGMGGGNRAPVSFGERNCFADVKNQGLGLNPETPDYITCKGTINFIKHDQTNGPWYHSCPDGEKYKVIEESNGQWRCERLNKTYDSKTNRYIMPFTASDWSGNQWMTAFDENAKVILGNVSADELEITRANDDAAFEQVFAQANFQTFVFKMRVKAETYEDEQRIKATVLDMQPLNIKQECADLIAAIENGPWLD